MNWPARTRYSVVALVFIPSISGFSKTPRPKLRMPRFGYDALALTATGSLDARSTLLSVTIGHRDTITPPAPQAPVPLPAGAAPRAPSRLLRRRSRLAPGDLPLPPLSGS